MWKLIGLSGREKGHVGNDDEDRVLADALTLNEFRPPAAVLHRLFAQDMNRSMA